MRSINASRKTGETDIELFLNLDGTGLYEIRTECGFMKHMLELFTRHGGFDLNIRCEADYYVDDHHAVEDMGIVLGKAFKEALGDKRGIRRYGSMLLPMDEALVMAACDISGRGTLVYDLALKDKVGTFDTELVKEFFLAFTREMGLTLHIRQISGENTHHIIEAAFKGVARALKDAVAVEGDEIPSTKGLL
ncbi:MAG: imidazoleglycerol-phosphate dehydratase HisB [Clostridiales bacterium]|nr:imidazoleglycerol-phosphate dehydratase HisB [Clostridiales bacterium]